MGTEDNIRNRIKYRNKSIFLCYLCNPTDGRECTFEKGKEWYLKDMHMLRYHQKEIVQEAVKKFLVAQSDREFN